MQTSRAKITFGIFAVLTVLLLFVHGRRMVLTNDEGIILDAAQRMVQGQRPYVDFFGYMSPGSYWMQALVFKIAGLSLWAGRLIVILDFALQAALVFWLTDRFATRKTAVAIFLAFTGFQIADPSFLSAAHRWDSATLALAGLALAVSALDRPARWSWYVVGALFAAAAWCTPSMAMVGVIAALWLLLAPERRTHLPGLALGAAAILLLGICALAATGSLTAFVDQMRWLSKNYSAVNVMPYGAIIGGYAALFEDTHGALEIGLRIILVTCLALPAILPPLALLVGAISLWLRTTPQQDRAALLLLTAAVPALVLTAFPRADVMHLAFIAALPYALAGAGFSRLLPQRIAPFAGLIPVMLAALMASNHFLGLSKTKLVPTPVGVLRADPKLAGNLELLLARVHPGESLFVYPYTPLNYFLTQARNPTTYSYLVPGMMTEEDARTTLDQLRGDPPQWLLYMELTPEEYLRVLPNAAGLSWKFETLEDWMTHHYQPVEDPKVNLAGYHLWQRQDTTTKVVR